MQTPKKTKVAAVAAVNPNELLTIDGQQMLWKSRTYIPGLGTKFGPVFKLDFLEFQKQLKAKSPTTEALDWISNEDLQKKAANEGRQKMKLRNGLS